MPGGRSTIHAIVAGLRQADRGSIKLGGEVWFDKDRNVGRPVHARGISFVFQSLALFPHMTARANVEYGIDRRLGAGERKRRAEETLARMRVAHLADRKPATFSGGEAQRVALARAFARSPSVVLLDEPFSALDRQLRKELCADVKNAIRDLGVPALLVTHHRNEARFLADRAILVDAGKVQAIGGVEELLGDRESGPPRAYDFDETPLGDFGVTLMVAGDIPGETQTASLAIYDAIQANRDADAVGMILVLSSVAIVTLYGVNKLAAGRANV